MTLLSRKLLLPIFGSAINMIVWSVCLMILFPGFADIHGYMDNYGTVIAIHAASMALFSFPGGRLSDILGRKIMIIIGNAIIAVSPFFVVIGNSFFLLLATSFFLGMGTGLSHSAFHAYIADISKKKRMSSSYGRISAVSMIFAAIGTLFIKEIVNLAPNQEAQLTRSFIIISLLCGIWTILAFRLEDTKIEKKETKIGIKKAFELFTPLERKIVIDMGIMQTVTGIGAALTVFYYTPYFKYKFGATTQQLYLVSICSILVLSLTTYISGEMGVKTRKLRFIQKANLLAIPMALGIIVSPIFFLAVGFYIGRNSMANMIWPLWSSLSMENIRKEMRGAANGFGVMLWNVVYIPAAFIGWSAMNWTKGWTIPLAAIMYATVTAYVRWHLKELRES